MKLLASLLETTAPPPRQPATPAPRVARPKVTENAQRVKRMITECQDSFLTLNKGEITALKALLENCNPFVRDKFSTGDLEMVGLSVDPNSQQTSSSSSSQRGPTGEKESEEVLPTHLALIAPDFTPAHSEPIPLEVARTVLPKPAPRQPREHTHIPSDDYEQPAGHEAAPPVAPVSEAALHARVQDMVLNGAPERSRRGKGKQGKREEDLTERERAAANKLRRL